MKNILITGFEPFGGEKINPSEKVVLSLDSSYDDYKINKLILPVEWGKSSEKLFSALDTYDIEKLIMVGQAGGDNCIRIERVGLNICGKIADVKGNYPDIDPTKEVKIFEDGENAYFSTFNYNKIYENLKAENIKSRISYSAGVYICNYILYSSLYKIKKENRNLEVGFIHVPFLEEQNQTSYMDFNIMKKAIEIVIKS